MGRRRQTTVRRRPGWSLLAAHVRELVQEIAPAFAVLIGVALLLRLRPRAQLVAALGHAQAGPPVALGGQRELDELGVPWPGLLPRGKVPAEGQAARRVHDLHHDRAALVAELQVAR